MTRALQFGEIVEVNGVWCHVVSLPDPFDPSLFRWRSGQRYTIPELIDPAEEEKIRKAPPPPDDPLSRYIVVRASL